MINNTFSKNIACYGGGIYSESHTTIVTNCILWSDSCTDAYREINDANISYCDVMEGHQGTGNINIDPRFCDPVDDDFHLMSTDCAALYNSPCIDAGKPEIYDLFLGCELGLGGTRSDMGAYGGQNVGWPMSIDDNGSGESLPRELRLAGNYPNPFNGTTSIEYSLSEPSDVVITIYDILGRCRSANHISEQGAGQHTFRWDSADAPSGVYLYRIQAGPATEAKKMLLIK